MSRATLSRIERAELSPTAAMLNTLCSQYRWTVSRLMAEAETGPPTIVREADQVSWTDPQSGFLRRVVSPPHPSLKGEMIEVTLPAETVVDYDASPIPGLEHHLWMLAGALTLELSSGAFHLQKGDCMRYLLNGPSRFTTAKKSARYVIAMVR